MSEKLKRLQKMGSAKTTTTEKVVKVDGFKELVDQLQRITVAQQKSHESLSQSLNDLGKVILMAGEQGLDTTAIVDAIAVLKNTIAEKSAPKLPMDYEIHFKRDKYNLMESGIRLTSVPKKLN